MRKKHGKTSVRVAARTSQADTVQYKKSEQYNTQKKMTATFSVAGTVGGCSGNKCLF
jgi:hypothetical protein